MASAFLTSEFGRTINKLRSKTMTCLEEAFMEYSADWHRMNDVARARAEKEIQLKVIDYLKEEYPSDKIPEISYQAQQWVSSKEGIIRQYLRSTEHEVDERLRAQKIKFVKESYVKVAVKCNSKGGDVVEAQDLNPWLNAISEQVLSPEHKKYLTKQRIQVRNNLMRMIAFPVSVKETVVDTRRYVSEEDFLKHGQDKKKVYVSEENFLNDSLRDKFYVPEGAKKLNDTYSKMIVTLNGIRYLTLDGKLIEEIEGRIKSNEAYKMGKFTSGIRPFPHYDGIGFKRKVRNIADIPNAWKSTGNISLEGELPDASYRFNGRESDMKYSKSFPFSNDYLKEARQSAEDSLINILRNPYVDFNAEVIRKIEKIERNRLLPGVWVDMKEGVSKAPVETQIKDSFADLIYGFYSPIGHNSIDYDNRRNEECKTKIIVVNKRSGKKEDIYLSSQLILNYQENEILRPAFSSVMF